jgi:hypothetical protein
MTQETYNLEHVYDREIAPLMAQILTICEQHHLPMVAAFAFSSAHDGDEVGICTSALLYPKRQPVPLCMALHAVEPPPDNGGADLN